MTSVCLVSYWFSSFDLICSGLIIYFHHNLYQCTCVTFYFFTWMELIHKGKLVLINMLSRNKNISSFHFTGQWHILEHEEMRHETSAELWPLCWFCLTDIKEPGGGNCILARQLILVKMVWFYLNAIILKCTQEDAYKWEKKKQFHSTHTFH